MPTATACREQGEAPPVDSTTTPDIHRPPGRYALAVAIAGVGMLAAAAASLAVGVRSISPAATLAAFTAYDPVDIDHLIIRDVRLPRTALGAVVGAALGVSGALMQGLTRNPIADPGLLGVNAGASVLVVAGLKLGWIGGMATLVPTAFVGALIASGLVYLLGWLGPGGPTPFKLVMAGVVISAFLISITQAIVSTDAGVLNPFRTWIVGSLASRSFDVMLGALPAVAVGVIAALLLGPRLDALALGDDLSGAQGIDLLRTRLVTAAVAALLVGAAVAAAGPLTFVGLVVPHIARLLVGPDYRRIIVLSAALAPTLVLASDTVGRVIARPAEVEVGVVTALVGAPYFLAMVLRRRMVAL